jgi:hypothetical protein
VALGSSLLWKWASREHFSQSIKNINSNATAELRKIPKEAFRRCFQQRQDRCNKCFVSARVPLWRRFGKRGRMPCHYSVIPSFRELFDCPPYVFP